MASSPTYAQIRRGLVRALSDRAERLRRDRINVAGIVCIVKMLPARIAYGDVAYTDATGVRWRWRLRGQWASNGEFAAIWQPPREEESDDPIIPLR